MALILFVEDNEEIRENLQELVELSGHEVVVAENGRSGFEKALEIRPDLILSDIQMPEMNGFKFLEVLKSNEETAHIPFVFVTASAEPSEVKIGLEKGANAYIRKPFEEEELMETIGKFV